MQPRSVAAVALSVILILMHAGASHLEAQDLKGIEALAVVDSVEAVVTGLSVTEGPVWHPDGYLLFSDIPGNTIYRWWSDGTTEVYHTPSNHSNGLTFDLAGALIVCEHSGRRVSRLSEKGISSTLAATYDGKHLNSPNDVVVRSDGSIYFTDPPFGLTSEFGVPGTQELDFQGVYRIPPDGGGLELLADDLRPNGLAFSPDESVLYVGDAENIVAFDVMPDGSLSDRRLFISGLRWPDGFKVDTQGNLYTSTYRGAVRVYNSAGEKIGDIQVPGRTTNCAFGGPGNLTLFVTSEGSVYRVPLRVPGIPAHPAALPTTVVGPEGRSTWENVKKDTLNGEP